MMRDLNWTHAVKVGVMLLLSIAISVMLTATPERYIYGGF
jgi:hypothetical protein